MSRDAFLKIVVAAAAATGAISMAALGGDGSSKLTAKDAGARYGQAIGAVEVCYGSKLTPKAEALTQGYSGKELDDFKAVAAETFQSWVKAKNCINQRDPNHCKIVMDKSCMAAAAEIGQGGTVIEGLVEFATY